MVCPASGFLHGPLVRPIYPSSGKKTPTALCDCHTRVWLPARRWGADMGLTIEQARAQGFDLGQRATFEQEHDAEGGRVVPCPAGGFLHPGPHAVTVVWAVTKKQRLRIAHALCTCGTHVWFGSPIQRSRWTERMGLTLEQAQAAGLTVTG